MQPPFRPWRPGFQRSFSKDQSLRLCSLVLAFLIPLVGAPEFAFAFDAGDKPLASSPFPEIVSAGGLSLTGRTRSLQSALKTTQTTQDGSIAEGAVDYDWTRTTGYGQYGNAMFRYHITAATPAPQFDVGLTTWATHTDLIGGQIFGFWAGSNTPSSGADYSGKPLSQVYSAGAAIGAEINVGNRWADFGLQHSPGARFTAGLQVVPDVLPAKDGPTRAAYPGTYGILLGASSGGHKWWVGEHIKYNTIMPGGYAYLVSGGSAAAGGPKSLMAAQGHWNVGIDFSGGFYTEAVLKFGARQTSDQAAPGLGEKMPPTVAGYLVIVVDGMARKIPYFAN